MRLVNKPSSFQPFDLRIETEAEANLLATLIGSTPYTVSDALGRPSIQEMYGVMSSLGYKGMSGIEVKLDGEAVVPV